MLNLAEGKTVGNENKKTQAGQRKNFVQGHCLKNILMPASIICDAEVQAAVSFIEQASQRNLEVSI